MCVHLDTIETITSFVRKAIPSPLHVNQDNTMLKMKDVSHVLSDVLHVKAKINA